MKLNKIDMPLLLLSVLSLKLTIFGASIGDALALGALAALIAYKHYVQLNKPSDINDEVIKKISVIEGSLVGLKMAQNLRSVQNDQSKRF